MEIQPSTIRELSDDASLLGFLRERLQWPVEGNPHLDFYEEPELEEDLRGTGVRVRSLVPESGDDLWLILMVEFRGEIQRRDLRRLLAGVRRSQRLTDRFAGREQTLFIVRSASETRFVRFTMRNGVATIRSFGWTPRFAGRTVAEFNLPRLRWDLQHEWDKAWDIEGLTEDFYKDFERVFTGFKEILVARDREHNADADRNGFTQLWFNRLLLLAFVERRDWLRTPEGRTDYLQAMWERHRSLASYTALGVSPDRIPNSFASLLGRAFVFLDTDEPSRAALGDEKPIIGDVPYLNGGLFHLAEVESHFSVPDEAFAPILGDNGLFARYNFTVTESSPLDQTVAIDPEMLGKVFERLVNDRHKEGKYYTPRPVVGFMVEEALKGYLVANGVAPEKAALLVEKETLRDPDSGVHIDADETGRLLEQIVTVRAVDPACGSGAYLLGLLQKLFALGYALEWRTASRHMDDLARGRFLYTKKLELVQRCIYGVDFDATAVAIARLRLWLSLAVENVAGERPRPLPYLDFKVAQGDSLMYPVATGGQASMETELHRQFLLARREAERSDGGTTDARRADARERALVLRKEIQETVETSEILRGAFPWPVAFEEVWRPVTIPSPTTMGGRLNLSGGGQAEFAEERVLRGPGFDIVVANPPYVNSGELLQSLGRARKDALVKAYPGTGSGTADLLVYFFERAVNLLGEGGQLVFVTSNKWLKAGYGGKLRGFLAARTVVREMLDYGDNEVFRGVIAYPLITIAGKGTTARAARFVPVPRFPNYDAIPDPRALLAKGFDLAPDALGTDGTWRLESAGDDRLARMRGRGVPLGEYVKGRIYYGIKTGLNEVKIGSDGRMYGKTVPAGVRVVRKEGVFVIDGAKRAELIAEDPKSAEIIKPLAVGKDVRRWRVEDNDRWLIVTRNGTDMTRYPAIVRHLLRYRELAEPRGDQGKTWMNLRSCAYYGVFDEEKIVYPDMVQAARCTLAPAGLYLSNTSYVIASSERYLLGVLNSAPFTSQLSSLLNENIGATARAFTDRMTTALVPGNVSDADRAAIESFVQRILDAKAADPEADVTALEAEIDRRVEHLYFGDSAARSYDEAQDAARAEVRALLRRPAEDATLEFKETLWWDVRQNQFHNDRVLDVAKAICAFLNRDGGTILIGVKDEGNVSVGIARDLERLGSPDKFQRKLAEPFGAKLSPDPSDLIRVSFVDLDGATGEQITLSRVDVTGDPSTMYTLDGKVYVRRDGESRALEAPDAAHWWARRHAR